MKIYHVSPQLLAVLAMSSICLFSNINTFAADKIVQNNSPTAQSLPVVKNNTTTEKVNINTASLINFEKIRGLGKKKASAIVDYRNKNGSFHSIEDLLKVPGIGEKLLSKFKNQLTLE